MQERALVLFKDIRFSLDKKYVETSQKQMRPATQGLGISGHETKSKLLAHYVRLPYVVCSLRAATRVAGVGNRQCLLRMRRNESCALGHTRDTQGTDKILNSREVAVMIPWCQDPL